jgi:hypothetical protein
MTDSRATRLIRQRWFWNAGARFRRREAFDSLVLPPCVEETKIPAALLPQTRTKPGPKGPTQELIELSSKGSSGIPRGVVPELPSRSLWPLALRSTRTWSAAHSPLTIDRIRTLQVHHG